MGEKPEEPSYVVITSFNDVEVRRYTSTVQAKVQTVKQASGAPSNGFRRVARYIFGGNQQGASIAMTAPVSMWDEGGSGWLAFTMPSAYSIETLPRPNDADVVLVECPEQDVAVLSFSGRTTLAKRARLEQRLRAAVEQEGLESAGPVVLAVYENPWTTLPFMRRNELHLRLKRSLE
ncbi:MAG: heme-binding protein [Candidatus Poseidonia sp.]|jgi:hypothetical protein|nr:heme-binding protein [Poseidonia sp.]